MTCFKLNNLFNINNQSTKNSVAHRTPILLKADTGASKHYVRKSDVTILKNVQNVAKSISVHMPNNEIIRSTTSGQLPIKKLSPTAKQAHVLPALTNTSLLSIGQLCNDDCIAIFTKTKMYILKQGQIILTGMRNYTDGLWDVICKQSQQTSLNHTTTNKLNILTSRDKTSYELANFLHACAGSPTIRTFQDAIRKNFLATWPGIHKLNMKFLIMDHTNISLGHLDQERKNIQSTKIS